MWIKYVIAVLAAGLVTVVYPTLEQRIIQPDDQAPSFSIVTDGGQTLTQSNFGGKVLVLNFWATWCPPCLEEFPALNRFAAQTKDSGVVVLGISVDKNEALYKRFLRSTRPTFQTFRDPDQDINSKYGSFQFPETYVIDSKGKVIKKYIGIIDNFPELEKLVKSL